jgi:uncharacterized membrane protein
MAIQHKLVLATTFLGPPFILWAALYLIARYSAVNMRRLVPWIRALRRLTSWTTLALLLLVAAGFPLIYACSSLGFSGVVILIDCWAFERFAPVN